MLCEKSQITTFPLNVYSLHTMLQLNFLNYKNQTIS